MSTDRGAWHIPGWDVVAWGGPATAGGPVGLTVLTSTGLVRGLDWHLSDGVATAPGPSDLDAGMSTGAARLSFRHSTARGR